jgi:hypothetical protein
MSSNCWTVIAFLASSRLAMVRSGKKSTTRRSVLSSRPSPSAIPASVLVTDLVAE